MTDFLDTLATDALATVDSGYYDERIAIESVKTSLKDKILESRDNAVIAEVKGTSPSQGTIRRHFDPAQIARAMAQGGAAGISVLTEPKHFSGSPANLVKVRSVVNLPVLMKDIIVDPAQIDAASMLGANAVLLIQAVFDRDYCSIGLSEMVAKAHSKNLEILLEAHTIDEFSRAVKTDADLVGINNRNLSTLQIDLNVTKNILDKCPSKGKVVISESGVNTPADVQFLSACGAKAFLIGSAVMSAQDVEAKVKEFVNSQ